MTRAGAKKHEKVIEAFLNGEEIEFKYVTGEWITSSTPNFDEHIEYRIKQKWQPKPFERVWANECIECNSWETRTFLKMSGDKYLVVAENQLEEPMCVEKDGNIYVATVLKDKVKPIK